MILLFEISFASGAEYLTNKDQAVVYDSNQYLPLITSVSSFQENQSPTGGYEVSPITVVLKDEDSRFRNIIRTDINIQGVAAVITDENGKLLYTTKIQSWQPGPLSYTIVLNHLIDFQAEVCDEITIEEFPNAVDSAINQCISIPFNHTTVKCWKVSETEHSSDYHFVICRTRLISISNLCIGSISNAASSSYLLTNDGTYDYVKILPGCYFVMGDYCFVDVVTNFDYQPLDIIEEVLKFYLPMGDNGKFANYLAANGYNHTTVSFNAQEELTVADTLTRFCISFNCNYRINPEGELIFTFIDTEDLQILELQPPEVFELKCNQPFDTLNVLTEIKYGYAFKEQQQIFLESTYTGEKASLWGKYQSDFQGYYFIKTGGQALKSAQKHYFLNQDPPSNFTAKLTTGKAADIYPGSLVRMQDSEPYELHSPNPICFYVMRKETNHDEDMVLLEMKSVDFLSPTDYWIGNNGAKVIANDYLVIISREAI